MMLPRRLSVPRRCLAACLALALCVSQSVLAVVITQPKPHARLSGTVPVTATAEAGEPFAYAMLNVDEDGRSASNSLPIRFELDTTQLANGEHQLRVDLADTVGTVNSSPVVLVVVDNPAARTHPSPVALPQAVVSNDRAVTVKIISQTAFKPMTVTIPASAFVIHRSAAPSVMLDGTPLTAAPILENGRMMVLLRALVDALQGTLAWDAATKQAHVTLGERTVVFTRGEATAQVNGERTTLPQSASIVDGRMLVPVVAWHNLCDGGVAYESTLRCVTLRRPTAPQISRAQ